MFLNSLNIAGSGLTAQRLRMDIISQNIANSETTGADGETYRRKTVTLTEISQPTFEGYLEGSSKEGPGGVAVTAIEEDQSDFKLKYDPTDPNANEQGYVALPNVDTVTEMTNLLAASKAYNADIAAFNAVKNMAISALEIGK
jgi:flagellar basal-body rod protein FlgC